MKYPNKLKWLAGVPLACLMLTSCQTTPAPASSTIEETAAMSEAAVCRDLQLPKIDRHEFNTASQYWRDLVLELDAVWVARCAS